MKTCTHFFVLIFALVAVGIGSAQAGDTVFYSPSANFFIHCNSATPPGGTHYGTSTQACDDIAASYQRKGINDYYCLFDSDRTGWVYVVFGWDAASNLRVGESCAPTEAEAKRNAMQQIATQKVCQVNFLLEYFTYGEETPMTGAAR